MDAAQERPFEGTERVPKRQPLEMIRFPWRQNRTRTLAGDKKRTLASYAPSNGTELQVFTRRGTAPQNRFQTWQGEARGKTDAVKFKM